jgi:ubiquinone/menaquinone biosynthesis C-methylase UbiE
VPEFDYDQGDIHRTYAAGRALRPEQATTWTAVLRQEVGAASPRRIVDLGCGVGRFSALLRTAFPATVFGVDRSARMLEAAQRNEAARGVRWILADAEALPVCDGSVDLIFMFLVFHHVVDRPAAFRECARVLARDGVLVIVTSTTESLDAQRWLPFFPSARAIDLARMPSRAGLLEAGRDAGLAGRQRTVLNPVAATMRSYADRIATRTLSVLQLVSDEEFARGMAEFRRHCERQGDEPVEDEIDVFRFRRVAGAGGRTPAG